jgi:hypothetical protein
MQIKVIRILLVLCIAPLPALGQDGFRSLDSEKESRSSWLNWDALAERTLDVRDAASDEFHRSVRQVTDDYPWIGETIEDARDALTGASSPWRETKLPTVSPETFSETLPEWWRSATYSMEDYADSLEELVRGAARGDFPDDIARIQSKELERLIRDRLARHIPPSARYGRNSCKSGK